MTSNKPAQYTHSGPSDDAELISLIRPQSVDPILSPLLREREEPRSQSPYQRRLRSKFDPQTGRRL